MGFMSPAGAPEPAAAPAAAGEGAGASEPPPASALPHIDDTDLFVEDTTAGDDDEENLPFVGGSSRGEAKGPLLG